MFEITENHLDKMVTFSLDKLNALECFNENVLQDVIEIIRLSIFDHVNCDIGQVEYFIDIYDMLMNFKNLP